MTTKYYYIILKILLHIVSLHSQRQIFSKWNSTFFWHYSLRTSEATNDGTTKLIGHIWVSSSVCSCSSPRDVTGELTTTLCIKAYVFLDMECCYTCWNGNVGLDFFAIGLYSVSWKLVTSFITAAGGLISVKNSKLSPNKRRNSSALIVPPSKSILDLADLRKCGWRILESIISIWIEIYTDISCTDALNYPITYICLKFYWYILNQNENHIDINCTDRCDYLDIYQNFYIDIKSYI